MSVAATLEVDRLRESYGSTHAVRDVSSTPRFGELVGLLGPNGAGKTTTVSIAGLTTPDAGRVELATEFSVAM